MKTLFLVLALLFCSLNTDSQSVSISPIATQKYPIIETIEMPTVYLLPDKSLDCIDFEILQTLAHNIKEQGLYAKKLREAIETYNAEAARKNKELGE